jgi:hypothetical protein
MSSYLNRFLYEQNEQKDFLENYFFNYLHNEKDGLLLTQHCFSSIRNKEKVHKRIRESLVDLQCVVRLSNAGKESYNGSVKL